jgi:acyl-CoA thioester hydrolase
MMKQSAENKPFTISLRVRFSDTDLQGHVFFGNYFTYCDEGFMAFLEEVGFSWYRLGTMGLELYYLESRCRFKSRGFFGDTLLVETGIVHTGRSSMKAQMTIRRKDNDGVVAIGQISAVMVSQETGRSTQIPKELRRAFHRHETGDLFE